MIVEAVRRLTPVLPRTTNTSNITPTSMPLSIATVAKNVKQLRQVWQKRNTLLVAAVREAHILAMRSMQHELSVHVRQAKAGRDASRTVAAISIRDRLAVTSNAAAERVAALHALERRRVSLKSLRRVSRSIGCAIAAEGRAETRAARYKATVLQHAHRVEEAAARFENKLQHEEAVDAMHAAHLAQRQAAAQEVREAGFTERHAEAQAASAKMAKAYVCAARLRERGIRELVGPAGGVWGGLPREVLRQPCPITAIVAAAQNYAVEVMLFLMIIKHSFRYTYLPDVLDLILARLASQKCDRHAHKTWCCSISCYTIGYEPQ